LHVCSINKEIAQFLSRFITSLHASSRGFLIDLCFLGNSVLIFFINSTLAETLMQDRVEALVRAMGLPHGFEINVEDEERTTRVIEVRTFIAQLGHK
jgi:hypothetical protein